MNKALAEEQWEHALTRKANVALSDKYCGLVGRNEHLEQQYNLLWESTSHSSNAKDTTSPSTSQGCGKCYNLDLNAYSTNLANMKAMRKKIARLNEIIGKGCMIDKAKTNDQKEEQKWPQYK